MKSKQRVFFVGFIFLSAFAMQETKQKFPIARRKSIPIIFKNGEPEIEDYKPVEKQKLRKKEEPSLKNSLLAQGQVESGNRKSSAFCDCKFW